MLTNEFRQIPALGLKALPSQWLVATFLRVRQQSCFTPSRVSTEMGDRRSAHRYDSSDL